MLVFWGVHGNTLDLAPRMHQDDHIFFGYFLESRHRGFICPSYWVGGVDPRNTSSFMGGGGGNTKIPWVTRGFAATFDGLPDVLDICNDPICSMTLGG